MELWNGYRLERSEFEGRELVHVFPENPNGKWALKTEYFGAFPAVEIELVKLGYHLFHVASKTRWHCDEDTEIRAKLAENVHSTYNLSKKCAVVGMSCGGMQGIYFGARYPQYVSCLYLDAPVVNFLSCPGGLGKGKAIAFEEFEKARGMSMIDLISYRDQPLDNIPGLVKNNIPIILVSGDADTVVPYDENGILIERAYRAAGAPIEVIIKKGGDHHPHSLEDNTPIIEFIKKYDV